MGENIDPAISGGVELAIDASYDKNINKSPLLVHLSIFSYRAQGMLIFSALFGIFKGGPS